MAEKPGDERSPALEAGWMERPRPRRGPKPALSVAEVVAAASKIADEEGLEAVSMGRVAKELGYTPMSLYRYVDNKQTLLALMLDGAVGRPPAVAPEEDWRTALERWAWAQLRALKRHPWALKLPIAGLQLSSNRLSWLDIGLQMLDGTPLTEHEKASSLLLLSTFILSDLRIERELQDEQEESRRRTGASLSYAEGIAHLIDAERYPALSRALAAGIFDEETNNIDDETTFGLARILDGIALLMQAGGSQP